MIDRTLVNSIQENYQKTLSQIADAAHASGRDPESVKLVVVTKKQPLFVIEAAIAAGVIPGILDAWPSVAGFVLLSFWRTSVDSPGTRS